MIVIGVSLLVYDHCLTLPDEVLLIWSAPRSFAKYAFLANRYLVAICLLIVVDGMHTLWLHEIGH